MEKGKEKFISFLSNIATKELSMKKYETIRVFPEPSAATIYVNAKKYGIDIYDYFIKDNNFIFKTKENFIDYLIANKGNFKTQLSITSETINYYAKKYNVDEYLYLQSNSKFYNKELLIDYLQNNKGKMVYMLPFSNGELNEICKRFGVNKYEYLKCNKTLEHRFNSKKEFIDFLNDFKGFTIKELPISQSHLLKTSKKFAVDYWDYINHSKKMDNLYSKEIIIEKLNNIKEQFGILSRCKLIELLHISEVTLSKYCKEYNIDLSLYTKKTKSIGEQYVCEILEKFCNDYNLYFKEQIKFSDCKNKRPLPFDFGIYMKVNNELLFLIEFDGVQHSKKTSFNFTKNINEEELNKNFIYIKQNDKIKNTYTKDKKISMLRLKAIYNKDKIQTIIKKMIEDCLDS